MQTDLKKYLNKEVVGGEQISDRSFNIVLGDKRTLNLCLDNSITAPRITDVKGLPFLKGARVLGIECRDLARQVIGPSKIADSKVVVVRTTKGVFRLKYLNVRPIRMEDVQHDELQWVVN